MLRIDLSIRDVFVQQKMKWWETWPQPSDSVIQSIYLHFRETDNVLEGK